MEKQFTAHVLMSIFFFLLNSSLFFFQPDIILFLGDPYISPVCHLTVYLNLPDVCHCT